ncbi:DUF6503 family protein [Nonlabens sp.]|uniref:DUF6503 family protein n=1 Tax=Nonlabens sp. TaxID=1888209 RepID=UPI0032642CC1
MKYLFLLLFIGAFFNGFAQEMTGHQLLDRAIKVHDPNGNWNSFKGNLQVTMSTPDKPARVSDIIIDLPAQKFSVAASRDSVMTVYTVDKENASVNKKDLRSPKTVMVSTEEDVQRATFMKNYYTYLYGLPMKLKDEGSIVANDIEKKVFKGKEYLVLKVTYLPGTGGDVWYFYFDPTSYKMEVYQFFRTDKNGFVLPESGEYILLSDSYLINGIHMPKVRKWYYNKDDKFLGADVITK